MGGRWLAILVCACASCGGDPASSDDDTTTVDAGGDPADASLPPFVLEASTSLEAGNAHALTTNLPARPAACRALPFRDPPCADLDDDDLVDAWEDVVLDRFRPLRRFDEDEQLIGDAGNVVGDVGRVASAPGEPLSVVVFVMLGYATDYGSCGGFTGHNGDSERVALHLVARAGGGPGDVIVASAYTAAHEGTANDHGQVFTGADLAQLVFATDATSGDPRWVVFPSADKHGTYATVEICEGVSVIPCLDEDCGPDGVLDLLAYDRLAPFVNAGEDDARLVDDLASLGFPGDTAWGEADFCGGLGGSGCSAPVRDKLVVDPFGVLAP